MKERILDVCKWVFIFIAAGAVFYLVYPKYQMVANGFGKFNTITGKVSANPELVKKRR